jgi:hypothetical protein
MLWGREIAGLDFDPSEGPAIKPLPMLVGVVLAPLGDAAPWIWLVIARAGALLAAVMAWRVAARLVSVTAPARPGGGQPALGRAGPAVGGAGSMPGGAGPMLGRAGPALAGAVAAAGVLLAGGFVWNGWLGNAEGLMLGLALVSADLALSGRHRGALVLAFAVVLLRTEAVPFVALYAAWVWRRDPGVRPWVAGGAAALPVLWLGPDLVATGDAFRSSERARIPNPGAPALAERPALESLERAVGLLPIALWAGAVLALVGAARRELPRLALLPAAAGVAWVGLIAAMAELGYSGEERYALPGAALVSVSAGAGIAWASRSVNAKVPHRGQKGSRTLVTAAIGLVLLGAAVYETRDDLRGDRRSLSYEARLYGGMDDAVEAAGGRGAVLRCRPVHTAPYSRPALAWRLRVHIHELSTEPAASGTTFRARPSRGARLGPPLRGRFREVAREGEWTIVASCGLRAP